MRAHSPVSKRNPPHVWGGWLVALLIAAAIIGMFAGTLPSTGLFAIFFQEATGDNAILLRTPGDGVTIHPEEAITFSSEMAEYAGTYLVKLYVSHDRSPEGEEDLVNQKTVRGNQTFTYTHIPTPTWEEGSYYWKITAENDEGTILESNVQTYEVRAPLAASIDAEAVYSSSCDSGPGGHASDPLGEKTYMGFSLKDGETVSLRFNKTSVHGIERVVVRASEELHQNALIIHQEFEKEEPFYTLPPISDVYKAIHIHQTNTWKNDSFYATVFFRVPKQWIVDAGRNFHEVHIEAYADGKWSPIPTFMERDEGEYYVFQSTLQGLPPFAIGACPYTHDGRLVRG